jgi:hypothetical protein
VNSTQNWGKDQRTSSLFQFSSRIRIHFIFFIIFIGNIKLKNNTPQVYLQVNVWISKYSIKRLQYPPCKTKIYCNDTCDTLSLLNYICCHSLTVLQSYCDTSYSRGVVNQMWILKNSKDLLEYLQSRSLSS